MKIHLSSFSLYFDSMINFEQPLFKVRLQYCAVCVRECVRVWVCAGGVGGALFLFLPM